ncbi:cryptochrome/photolyase family protein [Silanimonas lenta]|uniref:cryptochrome/photolyase family protein n=1 Tax=Silanimonas lenta TaxID=265429 RepID=UPI002FE3B887
MPPPLRHLVVVLGDQLDPGSPAFEGFDPERDAVWMAEVAHEATQVWSSKPRIALFLAAMRRFRDALRARGITVHYRALDAHAAPTLEAALEEDLGRLRPQAVLALTPGEWRLSRSLPAACARAGVPWIERDDTHFLCSRETFARWARGRREYRMEFFYREMRRWHGVLMDGEQPVGGRWNFDAENREAFDARGPGFLPAPRRFLPDDSTREVLALVERRFPGHPGSLAQFDWPLDPAQAEAALQDFIAHRLPLFGRWQDAMWTGEPWLYHSRISAALNLKLLDPRRVIAAAVQAWQAGEAPLPAVEGFVRQVLGWREFVRGLYWLRMPAFLEDNALDAHAPLPAFYWTGETEMRCLKEAIGQTLEYGYAHHIQRLMVTGLFAQLLGVAPKQVHAWYLAVYVDAVEWVELPNVLGMSQYADGGRMTSKPYVASGRYIERMSNYCAHCPYDPARATGPEACPFTTLYWDFLDRHRARFERHPRTALQWKHLARKPEAELAAIRRAAAALRARLGGGTEPVTPAARPDPHSTAPMNDSLEDTMP